MRAKAPRTNFKRVWGGFLSVAARVIAKMIYKAPRTKYGLPTCCAMQRIFGRKMDAKMDAKARLRLAQAGG